LFHFALPIRIDDDSNEFFSTAQYIGLRGQQFIDKGLTPLRREQMHNVKHTNDREFERADEVTYAHNLSGELTFLSEEGERISGYSHEEACQMNIAELLNPQVGANVCEQIIRDTTKRVGAVYEIDLIKKDGRSVPVEVSARVVLRNGRPLEVQGIAVPSVIRAELPIHQRAKSERSAFLQQFAHELDFTVASF
jgi:PAS domain S-box-containing protein